AELIGNLGKRLPRLVQRQGSPIRQQCPHHVHGPVFSQASFCRTVGGLARLSQERKDTTLIMLPYGSGVATALLPVKQSRRVRREMKYLLTCVLACVESTRAK